MKRLPLRLLLVFVCLRHGDVQAQGCVPGYYDEYLDGTEYQSYPEQKSKRLNVVTGAYL